LPALNNGGGSYWARRVFSSLRLCDL